MRLHPLALQFGALAVELAAASFPARDENHPDEQFEAIVRADVIDRLNTLIREACPVVGEQRVMTPLADGFSAAVVAAVAVAQQSSGMTPAEVAVLIKDLLERQHGADD